MKQVELEKWEDFEAAELSIFQERKKRQRETGLYVSVPRFRGHGDARWKLATTLERFIPGEHSMFDYYKIIRAVKPAVESLAEKYWSLDEYKKGNERLMRPPVGYEFMVYLRHYGFPSPLLDWSLSPYVAAFFAFRSQEPKDGNAAIYSYFEYYGEAKSSKGSEAAIVGLGHYITTDKRHFAQQCEYTICKKSIEKGYVYCNHEDALNHGLGIQDVLTKYILPRSERPKVLERLYAMNINAYSLFGNEESLMETLAYKELERYRLR